ncbi:bifunctional methylenetetrahydrofolate dehydrogenase/methenyltetrahydrofolate cyclohydrolase FolD [Candidatus Woesearchaeota archaeon]|nr:bifunctional methylenetetrahydrofolate dehydrogenase/methenyltetrahydrofolate cyclohydrolase FolD [Candidatus Woesearchaeota archaeon]
MMVKLLEGKRPSDKIKYQVAKEVKKLDVKPKLSVIMVGNNPASEVYVALKHKSCKEVGMTSDEYHLPENTTQEELEKLITKLNTNPAVSGILVQLPLPKNLKTSRIMSLINPAKDVDGFNPVNIGLLTIGDKCLEACTPKGIMLLLEENKIPVEGMHAVLVGKSLIVGKPLMQMLLNRNATVTVCHSKTRDLKSLTSKADILVTAVGKAGLIKSDMVKEGAVVIDVGFSRIPDASTQLGYRIAGDVDFENVKHKCSWITPNPGGVGPMTVAVLLQNTLKAYLMQGGR